MKSLLLFVFLFGSLGVKAQEAVSTRLGIELDALPFITGGYYLSGWSGANHLRARGVIASVNVPDFVVKHGFKDNHLQAYALIFDYFPKDNFEGIWWGGGIEYWDGSIKSKDENVGGSYENYVLTAGNGYVWYINKNVYLNPWWAVHGVVGGDQNVQVGLREYKPDRLTAEVSIKLGFRY